MTNLNSVEAYKKYGVTPSNLRFSIHNIFYFPKQFKSCLEKYYIKEISTIGFLAYMYEGTLSLPNDNIVYEVIYHKTDPTRLLRRQDHTTVKLSFRIADSIFNIPPTVLVMEVTN